MKDRLTAALRWSERYVKTDMVYLAHGSFWLGTAQVFSSLTSLILAIAFANLLPQDIYGNYRYVLSVAGILTMFTLTGMNISLAQSVARGFEGSFGAIFKTRVKWGLIAGAGSLAAAAYYFYAGNTILVIPFLIGAVFLPFFDPLNLFLGFLQGKKLFKEMSLYGNLEQVVTTAIFVALLFLTHNLAIIVLTYFLSWTAVRLFLQSYVLKKFKLNSKVDPDAASYGTHLSVMGFMSGAASYLDKLLVFHYVGAVDLAIYTIALAPVEQMKSLFKNIPNLALPIFSKKSLGEIDVMLYRRILQLLAVGAVFAGVYILIVPFVFPLLFPKYIASIHYSEWYALSMVFVPAVIFLGTAFQAKPELLKATYTGTVAGNVFLIGGMLILGYYFGVAGIIAARVLQYVCGLAFSLILWRWYQPPVNGVEAQ